MEANATSRIEMLEELERRFSSEGSKRRRLILWRKRVAWALVIGGARFLKRSIDVTASVLGMLVLAPLFLMVALAIKLTDRGPVLYWQTRVGQWGREFPFPKFRSMVMNADAMKDQLLEQSDHGDSVTFKMK